jgi:hypothetical protein
MVHFGKEKNRVDSVRGRWPYFSAYWTSDLDSRFLVAPSLRTKAQNRSIWILGNRKPWSVASRCSSRQDQIFISFGISNPTYVGGARYLGYPCPKITPEHKLYAFQFRLVYDGKDHRGIVPRIQLFNSQGLDKDTVCKSDVGWVVQSGDTKIKCAVQKGTTH